MADEGERTRDAHHGMSALVAWGPYLRDLVEKCGGDRSYTDLFYAEEAERILD